MTSSPQQRTALVSVVAAAALIAMKLAAGLASGSLGLVAEAIHSAGDLAAALLTLLAVRVAVRPADREHPYGHARAEHLGALAEGAFLIGASIFIASQSISRLASGGPGEVQGAWYAIAVLVVVMAIDAGRALVSRRASRRYRSAAFAASATHFASDLAGSAAVLLGLLLVRAGHPQADSIAALFVAGLVLVAAARLIHGNVQALMDAAPPGAEAAARRAIAGIEPGVELRRLRMREVAGRHFADVVVGASPGAAVAQGHALADAVEEAVEAALPGSDVVVHVEPVDVAELRERILASALSVPRVREIHNLSVLDVEGRTEVSLHLKLPGDLSLEEAHAVSSSVEEAIRAQVPEVGTVQTHIEPIAAPATGQALPADRIEAERDRIGAIVREATGAAPREVHFRETERGVVVFLTLGLDASSSLADAHRRATDIEARIRAGGPAIADVVVHTEP